MSEMSQTRVKSGNEGGSGRTKMGFDVNKSRMVWRIIVVCEERLIYWT